jgi:Lrp/AsnC family transcriptional regulator
MPEVLEFHRMAGEVDYMLRVVVPDMRAYDGFYKRLIGAVPLKNVTSRFSMERIKSSTVLPIPDTAEGRGGGEHSGSPEAGRDQSVLRSTRK